jgi:hypothetical protein
MITVNPEKFECNSCWNTLDFSIFGVERIGETEEWRCGIKCEHCFCMTTYLFSHFNFEDRLITHLKSIIGIHKKKPKPTSFVEWDLRTGKINRTSHKDGRFYDRIL